MIEHTAEELIAYVVSGEGRVFIEQNPRLPEVRRYVFLVYKHGKKTKAMSKEQDARHANAKENANGKARRGAFKWQCWRCNAVDHLEFHCPKNGTGDKAMTRGGSWSRVLHHEPPPGIAEFQTPHPMNDTMHDDGWTRVGAANLQLRLVTAVQTLSAT